MPLEILNRAFVFLRPSLADERAEISPVCPFADLSYGNTADTCRISVSQS
jgi:hypothetical protein